MVLIEPSRATGRRAAAALVLCAAIALLAASAWPSRADAAWVRCAGTFRVLHNDRIGRLALPRGNYKITILASGRPSCAQASRLFARFLQDFDGRLSRPWRISVATSTFVRSRGVGFHVKRVGRKGSEGGGGEERGGGGRHPANGRFCPATFRVLHNDRIGKLPVRKGRYWIVLLQSRGLSCGQASALFTHFLEDFSGNLPRPWRVQAQTGKFRRGPGGIGFRVKPVR